MTLIKAFIAVAAFAAGPFVSLSLLNSGTVLGAFCGLASGAVYGISFVAFVGLVMEKLR